MTERENSTEGLFRRLIGAEEQINIINDVTQEISRKQKKIK